MSKKMFFWEAGKKEIKKKPKIEAKQKEVVVKGDVAEMVGKYESPFLPLSMDDFFPDKKTKYHKNLKGVFAKAQDDLDKAIRGKLKIKSKIK